MKMASRLGCFALVVIAMLLIFRFYVIVPAGHRVVVFNLGKGVLPKQLGEGINYITPGVDRPVLYNVQRQTYSMSRTSWEGEVRGDDSMSAMTLDGQQVGIELSLRFHLDPYNVWRLHKEIGTDYIGKIVRPEIRSHTRMAIAEYPAFKVFSTERKAIESKIESALREKLARSYIIVDEVLLRDVTFSDAFQSAIIQKQIAQQNAQRMKYVLEKEQKEKQRRIILAQGEAAAIRLKGQAIAANTKVVSYEYVRKIAPNISTIITDGKSVPVPGVAR